MICSRINISHLLPCAEYSANNSFNYNGNNGKLNNNNKNNTYSVRPVLELGRLQTYFEDCPFPLSEIYDIYRITKKHKASKPSHLLFQLYYPQYLRSLWQDINNCHYRPSSSIAFTRILNFFEASVPGIQPVSTLSFQLFVPLAGMYQFASEPTIFVFNSSLVVLQEVFI